jgi:hypothetical protein
LFTLALFKKISLALLPVPLVVEELLHQFSVVSQLWIDEFRVLGKASDNPTKLQEALTDSVG